MPKLPGLIKSERFTEATFKPYVTAIGRLVLGWNALHEELANIFCRLMGSDSDDSRSLAVWHSVQFDRPKRTMLRGALEAEKHRKGANRDRLDDMIWLLNEADKLENARNDAVHSPLFLLGYGPLAVYAGFANQIIPDIGTKNPRALQLLRHDVLAYFRWTGKVISILRRFVGAANDAWEGGAPWPDRPSLPARPVKKESPLARYQAPTQ